MLTATNRTNTASPASPETKTLFLPSLSVTSPPKGESASGRMETRTMRTPISA